MPQSNEFPEDLRKRFVDAHQAGKGYNSISKEFGLHQCSEADDIQMEEIHHHCYSAKDWLSSEYHSKSAANNITGSYKEPQGKI